MDFNSMANNGTIGQMNIPQEAPPGVTFGINNMANQNNAGFQSGMPAQPSSVGVMAVPTQPIQQAQTVNGQVQYGDSGMYQPNAQAQAQVAVPNPAVFQNPATIPNPAGVQNQAVQVPTQAQVGYPQSPVQNSGAVGIAQIPLMQPHVKEQAPIAEKFTGYATSNDSVDSSDETLGHKLRRITAKNAPKAEIRAFEAILTEAANNGETHVKFSDIREQLPSLIMSGSIEAWMQKQELTFKGRVNPSNAKWEYTVSWE